MLKLIILLGLSYLLLKVLYRKNKTRFTPKKTAESFTNKTGANESQQVEALLECPQCATFFQRKQGIVKEQKIYCSQKCADS
ncbi:MAG: hypothetical protein H7A33_03800 [Deltaproteobacteria bacterium]|nr:hypothetical protein [Deltaproteobacteria bacterium]